MSVRPIVLYPESVLRQKAEPVDPSSAETLSVLRDLWDTLDNHAGVGIAAPQIGAGARIIAIDATRARRPVPNHGRLALINPRIILAEGQISFREGCLSVPDFVAHIRRAERVTISAFLPGGHPITIETAGFESVILQHEIDHLDGMLFIDRVHNARDLKPRTQLILN
ncbi:MAG: peptide deformylase [bacterium]|nr:peptide deformylase [Candidatus Sumerlaeota bacterium]